MIGLHSRRLASAGALVLIATGTLAGCGSESNGSSAVAASGQPQGGQNADSTQLAAIQKCLSEAGISMPTPPSGQPAAAPSGAPGAGQNGAPPNGSAGGGQAGGGQAGGGQAGGMFSDAKVVAALKACGITVPTNAPGQPGAAPSPSSTS